MTYPKVALQASARGELASVTFFGQFDPECGHTRLVVGGEWTRVLLVVQLGYFIRMSLIDRFDVLCVLLVQLVA